MRSWLIVLLIVATPAACLLDREGKLGGTADGGEGGEDATITVGSGGAPGGMGGVGALGGMGGMGGVGGQGGNGGDGGVAQQCPVGEFATSIDNGVLSCATLDAVALEAINDSCAIYSGWRDNCEGCTDPPSKWGFASANGCTSGAGSDSTCTTPTLSSVTVNLFGLGMENGVDNNDTFHLGLHCEPPSPAAEPCAADSYISAVIAGVPECTRPHGAIVDYVRTECDLYWGWRDSCDDCADPPTKWGRVSDENCANGAGADNLCTAPDLGGTTVDLFGLNTDGTVDGNDKFYVGFYCKEVLAAVSTHPESCPMGELLVGLNTDGTILCSSPRVAAQAIVRDGCHIYFGWRNNCDGCNSGPSKWGRVSHSTCEQMGNNNTCSTANLGGTDVQLVGINLSGSVNDNDTFFYGMQCL